MRKKVLVVIVVMIFMGTILIFLPRIFEAVNKNTYHFIFKTNTEAALHNSAIEFLREASDTLGIAKVRIEVKEEDIVILSYVTEMELKKILKVIQPDKSPVSLILIAVFKGERLTP